MALRTRTEVTLATYFLCDECGNVIGDNVTNDRADDADNYMRIYRNFRDAQMDEDYEFHFQDQALCQECYHDIREEYLIEHGFSEGDECDGIGIASIEAYQRKCDF